MFLVQRHFPLGRCSSANDTDDFVLNLCEHDDDDPSHSRANSDESIFISGVCLVKQLQIVSGAKQFIRVFEREIVLLPVGVILRDVPIDLHLLSVGH